MVDCIAGLYGLGAPKIERSFESGTANRSYLITSAEGEFVLRSNKRLDPRLERSLSFQEALFKTGGPVAAPMMSVNGHFVELVSDSTGQELYVSLLRYVPGRTHTMIPKDGLDEHQCFRIGRSIAKLHEAMMSIDRKRFSLEPWDSSENYFSGDPSEGQDTDDPIVEKYLQQRRRCMSFGEPQQAIHGDMHFDNIILGDDRVVFCDFDECCIGDAKMDLALLLLDLPIVVDPSEDWATIDLRANKILLGYSSDNVHGVVEMKDLSDYQKLFELSLYLAWRQHSEQSAGDGWIPRFFRDRKRRIMENVEYWHKRAT
jgi:Ser/Thr protein kinase RdoA (MazF antagonist)